MHENTFSSGHFSAVDSARGHFQNIFSSTVDRLEEKIGSLKEENRSLKKEVADLQDSMQFHSDKLDEKFDEISNRSNHNNRD